LHLSLFFANSVAFLESILIAFLEHNGLANSYALHLKDYSLLRFSVYGLGILSALAFLFACQVTFLFLVTILGLLEIMTSYAMFTFLTLAATPLVLGELEAVREARPVATEALKVAQDFFVGGENASLVRAKLSLAVNVGCEAPQCAVNATPAVTVAHVIPEPRDSPAERHWVWSVLGRPAVQVALTPPEDDLFVNWADLLTSDEPDTAIRFKKKPHYSAAVMLANV